MKNLIAATAMLFATTVQPAYADFSHGPWFGKEDWNTESCRMMKHISEQVFFVVELNYNDQVKVGIYDPTGYHNRMVFDDSVGSITFDGKHTLILHGVSDEKNNLVMYESSNYHLLYSLLKMGRFFKMTIDVNDTWMQSNLEGSSKAMNLLKVCASVVWPGAGDEEEAKAAEENSYNSHTTEEPAKESPTKTCSFYAKNDNQNKVTFLNDGETVWIEKDKVKDVC